MEMTETSLVSGLQSNGTDAISFQPGMGQTGATATTRAGTVKVSSTVQDRGTLAAALQT